jgi:hypothetical protein
MTRDTRVYALAGFLAGLVTVGLGQVWRESLAFSGGCVFGIALVIALWINHQMGDIKNHLLRYCIGLLSCAPAYVIVVLILASVGQAAVQRLGVVASADIRAPGLDMMIGLFVAVSTTVIFIEILAAWLTRAWSLRSLFASLLFASGALFAALLINVPLHSYWSLFGVLFPLAEGLLMWHLGSRISMDSRHAYANAVN